MIRPNEFQGELLDRVFIGLQAGAFRRIGPLLSGSKRFQGTLDLGLLM
jgi:hypothetical protein